MGFDPRGQLEPRNCSPPRRRWGEEGKKERKGEKKNLMDSDKDSAIETITEKEE